MIKKGIILVAILLGAGMSFAPTRARIMEYVRPVTDGIKTSMAERKLDVLADQVELHHQRTGRYPGTVAPWSSFLANTFSGDAVDPWDNEWFLRQGARGFTVGSMGPDGEEGTPDDITVERATGR